MKKTTSIYLLITIIAVSCSTLVKDPNSDQAIAVSKTPESIGAATTLITSTSSPMVTMEPVGTSLLTLDSQNPSITVKNLLNNNGDCQLPCWWGIVPGKTTWQDAHTFFSPIATSIYESTKPDSNPRYFEVFFPAPPPFEGEFKQGYLIKNDVVTQIEILPQNFSKYSLPKELFQEFGVPEKVLLGGSVDQDQSFQLVLYYPERGIFAMYVSELRPSNYQEQIDICFTEVDYVDMFLWDPTESFSETMDNVFRLYEHPFYDIETVTTLTLDDFNNIFTDSEQPDCFLSPSSFWIK